LRVLIDEGMIANASVQGERLLVGLRQLDHPAIREARGRGLMLALELHPEAGGAKPFTQALRERGVLCKETHEHTIRIAPPLVITEDEVDWALLQFERVFAR
jgi:ornithine--oxo-acid transaminase